MSYVISENDLAVLRRVCNDLAGLIAGRTDVPGQYHEDVVDALDVMEKVTRPAPAKTVATMPAPAPTPAVAEAEAENS